jgi:exportin-2 (importin alpha re-exporter)
MLEAHTTDVPSAYRSLVPFLLVPAPWQQKGSIPGLVKLLTAFIARDAPNMVAQGQHTNVLAIVQQRLIPSKVNDAWGFELLQAVFQYVPACVFFASYFSDDKADERSWAGKHLSRSFVRY